MRPIILSLALLWPVAATSGPDCYCTDRVGARVELGGHTCLTIGGRSFRAYCDMSQNNPIWRDTGEACVTG